MTERLHFYFSLSCTGEGNGNPLQCSCLENPRDGGAWWAAVYGVAQSQTQLKRLSSSKLSFKIQISGFSGKLQRLSYSGSIFSCALFGETVGGGQGGARPQPLPVFSHSFILLVWPLQVFEFVTLAYLKSFELLGSTSVKAGTHTQ